MAEGQPMFGFTYKSWNGYITCVRHMAGEVRREMGETWNQADWRAGWKIIRKRGGRVVKVSVQQVQP